MDKLGFEIITTVKNEHRQRTILSSWLGEYPHCFYTDVAIQVGTQIGHTSDTSYKSGEIKFVREFNRLRSKPYAEWYFFCDDDTVPNVKLILEDLDKLDKMKVHGRATSGSWKYDRSLLYCSGGAGFLISTDLMVNKDEARFHNVGFSDVNFGLWARENKVDHIHDDRFRWKHPSQFGFNINDELQHGVIRSFKSFHYIKERDDVVKLTHIFSL